MLSFKWLSIIAAIVAIGLVVWAFRRQGQSTKIATSELRFPCLRIIDDRMWDVIDTPDAMGEMHSDRYMNRNAEPWLIDSEMRVIEMSKLKMHGNSLTLLITGPRILKFDYELILRQDKPVEEAKAMIKGVMTKMPYPPPEESILGARTLKDYIDLLETARLTRSKPPAE